MRWSLAVAVLLGLSNTFTVSPVAGQGAAERLAAASPASGIAELTDSGYFATSGVCRFQIIQGRLQLDPPRHRKGAQQREKDSVFESINVTACRGAPSLHYVYQTPERQLTLSVDKAFDVRIESWLPKSNERAVLVQPKSGDIRWTIQRGELKESLSDTTLLHIYHRDPHGFDRHCGKLIELLLRGRSVRSICDETRRALIEKVSNPNMVAVSRQEILTLIEKLSSKKHAQRTRAERALTQIGTPIIPIVHSIPRGDLDVEQKDRLQKIMRRIRRLEDDTAASLALLLMNDRQMWTEMAPHINASQLAQANKYLSEVGLQPIAASATPEIRIATRP